MPIPWQSRHPHFLQSLRKAAVRAEIVAQGRMYKSTAPIPSWKSGQSPHCRSPDNRQSTSFTPGGMHAEEPDACSDALEAP